jgi:glycogen debranching enzyme
MMCSLFMLRSGDAELQRAALDSIVSLGKGQAANGQIPNFVKIDEDDTTKSDWWYIGCPDATMWWLIAVYEARRFADLDRRYPELKDRVEDAKRWLLAHEHQQFFLIPQGEGADWADVMPRSGFVLYTNALWYATKRRHAMANLDETRRRFIQLFFPWAQPSEKEDRRAHVLLKYAYGSKTRGLGRSFVTLSGSGREGDVLGNLLAILYVLLDDRPAKERKVGRGMAENVVGILKAAGVNDPYPARAVVKPIKKKDRLWCKYMLRHGQNRPWQYHNGGLWPVIGGFWVLALVALDKRDEAREELVKLARANEKSNWRFSEWLHGKTLEPNGQAGQTWNAGLFLLAKHALDAKNDFTL